MADHRRPCECRCPCACVTADPSAVCYLCRGGYHASPARARLIRAAREAAANPVRVVTLE